MGSNCVLRGKAAAASGGPFTRLLEPDILASLGYLEATQASSRGQAGREGQAEPAAEF